MNVIIDIEWVQENSASFITQLAAVRVSDSWEIVDAFDRLVSPVKWWKADWEHMAYHGYSPEEFRAGTDEQSCITDLLRFLRDDDTLLCWHNDTKRLLVQKAELYLGKAFPVKCRAVNQKAYAMASARGITAHNLYEMAEKIGISLPAPQHQSSNDVTVLRQLLSALKYGVSPIPAVSRKTPKKGKSRAERNADILSRAGYNYIFAPDSKVFHKPVCHLMRQAREIMGCVYYKTAVRDRIPCRVCRPEPIEQRKSPKAKPEKAATSLPPERKVVLAKLLGNQRIEISNAKLVGFCHNMIHPGSLTRKIMEEHDCPGKNCKYFEKYSDSTYWIAEEKKRQQKEQRKQLQRAEKEAAQKQKDKLTELKSLFQSYADEAGYEMLIVRLDQEQPNRYRVFYVSANPFADGDRFPDFLAAVRFSFPQFSIRLRHIKDLEGRFVTISEYLSKKR